MPDEPITKTSFRLQPAFAWVLLSAVVSVSIWAGTLDVRVAQLEDVLARHRNKLAHVGAGNRLVRIETQIEGINARLLDINEAIFRIEKVVVAK